MPDTSPQISPEFGTGAVDLVLVGRDLGRKEVEKGKPFANTSKFSGAAYILNKALAEAGIRRKDLAAITNVVNRKPAGNRFEAHSQAAIDRGIEEMWTLLDDLDPNCVVALGNEAAHALIPDWPTKKNTGRIQDAKAIQRRRGFVFEGKHGGKVVPTVHPSFIQRGAWVPFRMLLTEDLSKAKEEAKTDEFRRPERNIAIPASRREARQMAADLGRSDRCAADIEITNGQKLACLGFAPKRHRAVIFPAKYIDACRELLEGRLPRLIWANGQFDLHFLHTRCGIDATIDDDTQLAWHSMYPELAGKSDQTSYRMTRKSLSFLASLYTREPWWKCVDAETPVLTADLRWVPIKDVDVGDAVVGFDTIGTTHTPRKLRKTEVTGKNEQTSECKRIVTETKNLVATDEHWVLMTPGDSTSYEWRQVADLRPGDHLCDVVGLWDEQCGRDVGWLAGFFAGEGHYQSDQCTVNVSQNPGDELEKAEDIIEDLGYDWHHYYRDRSDTKNTEILRIAGGFRASLAFLGEVRPERLIKDVFTTETEYGMRSKRVQIQEIEDVGTRPVCDITTTTRSFVANGLAVHNSYDFANDREMYELNGRDCMVTLEIMQQLDAEIDQLGVRKIYEHSIEMVWPAVKMQARGLHVDDEERKRRLQKLTDRYDELASEINEMVQPLLEERKERVEDKVHLFRRGGFETENGRRETCPCCNGGKRKRESCTECAGVEGTGASGAILKSDLAEYAQRELGYSEEDLDACTKADLRELIPECEVCNGDGKRVETWMNPTSDEQQKLVLYELLKADRRYNKGSLTTDESALRSLKAEL